MSKLVFISSTCYDLIDLRSELKEFILKQGLTPIMSDHADTEFETFRDKNSIESCLVNLRKCDVVILILSKRYGPSLQRNGFSDHSATHLEYKEAMRLGIKTVVFVRDRLEADYNIYQKSKTVESLSWVDEKNLRLFEIITEHKKLTSEGINNWYWMFRSSLDLKERLKIDLKGEIGANRLDELVSSGNCPMLAITAEGTRVVGSLRTFITLTVENFGTQSAIEPFATILVAKDYDESLNKFQKIPEDQRNILAFKSLKPGDSQENRNIEMRIPEEDEQSGLTTYVVEIFYRTIFGDLLTDVTELKVSFKPLTESYNLQIYAQYKVKTFLGSGAFEKEVITF